MWFSVLDAGEDRFLPHPWAAKRPAAGSTLALALAECQPCGGRPVPTYEYACRRCGAHHEIAQSFSDPPLTECPSCAGELRKVFGAIGIAFKGSGFYRTDSRSDGRSGRTAAKTEGQTTTSSGGGDSAGGSSGSSGSNGSGGDGGSRGSGSGGEAKSA
jgi:putative FmdB family regulatory protein